MQTAFLAVVPILIGLTACDRRPVDPPVGSSAQAETFDPARARALAIQSRSATEAAVAVMSLEQATRLAPTMVDAWLLLAARRVEQGDVEGAFAALDRLPGLGVRAPIDGFEPLQPLAGDARWPELVAQLDAFLVPAGTSELLFEMSEKGLLTEGIAYDPVHEAWYVSTVHGRKVVRVGADGTAVDFLVGEGVTSVFGMAIDPARRALWATIAAVPQMRGFGSEHAQPTAVLKVDLDGGGIVARYELADVESSEGAGQRRLNDIALAADGTIYATDLVPPGGIYRLKPGETELRPIGEELLLSSPQGLVLLDDDSLLVVADYSLGLVALDLGSGASWYIEPPEDLWLQTLDGLARVDANELVAIQNGGYPPHRILRFQLSEDRRRIASWEIAARALPEWHEPTLGVVVGESPRRFVYVAASQWPLFPEDGPPDLSLLQSPKIMSIDLAAPGDLQ